MDEKLDSMNEMYGAQMHDVSMGKPTKNNFRSQILLGLSLHTYS